MMELFLGVKVAHTEARKHGGVGVGGGGVETADRHQMFPYDAASTEPRLVCVQYSRLCVCVCVCSY